MTPATLNAVIRKKFPTSHQWVRRITKSLLMDHSAVMRYLPAIPRQLESERVWVHPRFFATPLDVEPHVRHWLHEYLNPGGIFFDVGAYVGWHALCAARLVGSTGKVLAFEASPANAHCLDFHRAKNGLSQMEVVLAAVADKPSGELMMHLLNGGDSTSNSIQFGKAYADSQAHQSVTLQTIPMTNLDSHAARYTPNLIKIDVEGAELLVLRGAEEIMTNVRPPILLAAHPSWLAENGTPEQLIDLLHSREYEIFDMDGKPTRELEFADYLCLPNEHPSLC